jgi:hypothetical protein
MALTFGYHGQQIPLTALTPALSQGARVACMPVADCRAYRLLPPGESGVYADARRADEGNSDLAPAFDPRKVSAISQGWRRSNPLPPPQPSTDSAGLG